jgi:hypothetical protein
LTEDLGGRSNFFPPQARRSSVVTVISGKQWIFGQLRFEQQQAQTRQTWVVVKLTALLLAGLFRSTPTQFLHIFPHFSDGDLFPESIWLVAQGAQRKSQWFWRLHKLPPAAKVDDDNTAYPTQNV